jgi:hypothetical protein
VQTPEGGAAEGAGLSMTESGACQNRSRLTRVHVSDRWTRRSGRRIPPRRPRCTHSRPRTR